MKKEEFIQKTIGTTFLLVYIFASLFTTGFHKHHSGFHQSHQFKKGEKSFSIGGQHSDNDCLVCDIICKKDSATPYTFSFKALELKEYSVLNDIYHSGEIYTQHQVFGLRGPPSIFI